MGKALILSGSLALEIVDLDLSRASNDRRCSFTLAEDKVLTVGRKYKIKTPDGRVFGIHIDGMVFTREGTTCSALCEVPGAQDGFVARDEDLRRNKSSAKPVPLPQNFTPLVLIVEDDGDVRESLQELLRATGFEVLTAPNGREALNLLHSEKFHPSLVLLDLMMPEMDGWEFRRLQKEDERLRDIPVVAITAGGRDQKPIDVDLILKPFNMDTLLRAVHTHCPRAA